MQSKGVGDCRPPNYDVLLMTVMYESSVVFSSTSGWH